MIAAEPHLGSLHRPMAPVNAKDVCVAVLPVQGASVAVSHDEALLAVCKDSCVDVWSLAQLASGIASAPLTKWTLPGTAAVKHVSLP